MARKRWRGTFLRLLAETANVKASCAGAGIKRQTAYYARNRDAAFRAAWDDALAEAVDVLEAHAFERAKESDQVLIFLLKSHRPERYRETVRIDVQREARRLATEFGLDEAEVLAEAAAILERS